MKERIKISVAVLTYNQQNTIAQTLDSILMQKGDFDLEIVIGEDFSKDNTLAICQEYKKHYPKTIKLLSGPHNLGIMANYVRTRKACSGDFISGMPGDDYYCDNHALEKQMQYLQEHPDVGVLAANGYSYYVRRDVKVPGLNKPIQAGEDHAKEYYFSPSYVEGAYFAPIGMMYRAEIMQYINLDEMLCRQLPVEDVPVQAILSQHTRFACLPDLLVVYRVYKESATFISYNHPNYLTYYRGLMETRRYLNELFPKDACFTEIMLQERMFHKEFLYYVYHMEYSKAQHLIASLPDSLQESQCVIRDKKYAHNRLIFAAYHYYKRYKKNINILKQT